MEGIYFDISVVRRAQAFASTLFLTQCTQSGEQEPLRLLPNSMKLVANLLGWKKSDGTRLYRKCYYSVARKNTKTQTAAFLGLNQMFLDPEPEQRIYVAAKERAGRNLLRRCVVDAEDEPRTGGNVPHHAIHQNNRAPRHWQQI